MDFTDLLEKILEREPYSHWKQVSNKAGEEKYRDFGEDDNPSVELSRFGLYCYKQQQLLKNLNQIACEPSVGLASLVSVKVREKTKAQTALDERRERQDEFIARWLGKAGSEGRRATAKQRWCGKDLPIIQAYFCQERGLDQKWLSAKFLYQQLEAYVVQYKKKNPEGKDPCLTTEIRVPLRDIDGNLVQLWRCEVNPETGERVGKGKTLLYTADRDRVISFGSSSPDQVVAMEGLENALVFYFCLGKAADYKIRMLVTVGKSGFGKLDSFLLGASKSVLFLDKDTDNGAISASTVLGSEVNRYIEHSASDLLDCWQSGENKKKKRQAVTDWFAGCKFIGLEEAQAIKDRGDLREERAAIEEPLAVARMRRPWTDAGAAKQFLVNFENVVRVSEDNRWWCWNKNRGCWSPERAEGQIREWIISLSSVYERIAREEFAEGSSGREKCSQMANALCNTVKQNAVMKIIHGARGLDCRVEDFDARPELLNLKNGVLNLDTGELLSHSPDLMCSRQAAVSWPQTEEEKKCERFDAFLSEIMCENSELMAYKLRQWGYLLSGYVSEKVLFFHLGSGNNGKSVEAALLLKLLGDYGITVGNQLLLERWGSSHSSEEAYELARLPGARLAVCGETDENKAWSEASIKRITGDEDRITARVIKQKPFEFQPYFRIVVHGNNHPKVKAGDIAFWNRIHLIPYELVVDRADAEFGLVDTLLQESSGIIWRLWQGYREWKSVGLEPPKQVQLAKEQYQADLASDVAEFVAVGCKRVADAETKASELYSEYVKFCKDRLSIRAKTQTAFGRELSRLGFSTRKCELSMMRVGLVIGDFDTELDGIDSDEDPDEDDGLIH